MKKAKLYAYIALGAAVMSLSSMIALPGAVPVTLQSLALLMISALLPPIGALAAAAVYIALGALGLPVFALFGAGLGILAGPTGGFVLGFLAAAPTISFLYRRGRELAALVIGILILYITGTLWYALVTDSSPLAALYSCVLPFILPDAAKILLARILIPRIKKAVDL